MDSVSRLIRVHVCLHLKAPLFSRKKKKSSCYSPWPRRSCWVHLEARNSRACLAEWRVRFDRAEWIFIGSNGCSDTIVLVLIWVSWVQCISACLSVLVSLVVDISVSVFVCVLMCWHLYVSVIALLVGWSLFFFLFFLFFFLRPVECEVRCSLRRSCSDKKSSGQFEKKLRKKERGGEKGHVRWLWVKMGVKV